MNTVDAEFQKHCSDDMVMSGRSLSWGMMAMKLRITAVLIALFLCLFAGCAPSPAARATETASDPYAGNSPSVFASSDTTSGIQPPHSTQEPSVIVLTETAAPTKETDASPSQEIYPPSPLPADTDFVRVLDYVPSVLVELKYATSDNFTGQAIYDFSDAYLRYGTVKKLMTVQEKLTEQGFCLKIWDAFRPVGAQFKLWEACPDPNFVANPEKGYSSHSKGNTVDVTLVYSDGTEVKMPTGFDDFSELADRDYADADPDAAANALLLEAVMLDCGFTAYSKEWWHFSDTTSYPVEESFIPPMN
jgi:D-alanyl-D-alanine dipeptidase